MTLLALIRRALFLSCLAALPSGVVGSAQPRAQPTDAPQSVLGATPDPQRVPAPGPVTGRPYAPRAILPGGIVVPLYPPGSPRLQAARVREAEVYSLTRGVPGRIASIVNIHNPSVELHRVPAGMNTGAAVIVVAGGGHNTLNVGSEGSDFVPFFYNYGINTVILRNRLRRDGEPHDAGAHLGPGACTASSRSRARTARSRRTRAGRTSPRTRSTTRAPSAFRWTSRCP